MNDQITPPSMDFIPGTGFDHFGEDDYNYEDLTTTLSLPSQVDAVITPPGGALGVEGYRPVKVPSAPTDFRLFGEAKAVEQPVRLARPPRLLASWVARMLMSKKQHRLHWGPIIADMLNEYYECLAEGDEWAARRAVTRHNLQAVPRWLKALALSIFLRGLDWLKGGL